MNKTSTSTARNAMPPSPLSERRAAYVEPSLYESDGGNLIGLNPVFLPKAIILDLGHPPSPIRAIRAKCLDCCGGSDSEARKCTAIDCPLWPLRMGKNVYHARAGGGDHG